MGCISSEAKLAEREQHLRERETEQAEALAALETSRKVLEGATAFVQVCKLVRTSLLLSPDRNVHTTPRAIRVMINCLSAASIGTLTFRSLDLLDKSSACLLVQPNVL